MSHDDAEFGALKKRNSSRIPLRKMAKLIFNEVNGLEAHQELEQCGVGISRFDWPPNSAWINKKTAKAVAGELGTAKNEVGIHFRSPVVRRGPSQHGR